ncbi:hypothetical protein FQA39_LY16989 [Lamprigera yunnana]|nr:hypothetical protein FQA39_LY16989 [Lamprigera yunnana]
MQTAAFTTVFKPGIYRIAKKYLQLQRNRTYLIEVNWNGNNLLLNSGRKLSFQQYWDKCENLQNVVSVDVEAKTGRLWILDKGTKKCYPKIVIYDLYTNIILHVSKLDSFADEELSYLVVDQSVEFGTFCYVGQKSANKLIVFSLDSLIWSIIKFDSGPIRPERIVISRSDLKLFLTADKGDDVLALNLTDVRSIGGKRFFTDHTLDVAYVGKKLGPSTGIAVDIAGGLNYYLPRDHAVVRWDTRKPLMAEYHSVLLQSYDILPYVSHLFSDPQNNIWALINPSTPEGCNDTMKSNTIYVTRVVQLSTFFKRSFNMKMFGSNFNKLF